MLENKIDHTLMDCFELMPIFILALTILLNTHSNTYEWGGFDGGYSNGCNVMKYSRKCKVLRCDEDDIVYQIWW